MALFKYNLEVIKSQILPRIAHIAKPKMAMLSNHDLICSINDLCRIFGLDPLTLKIRQDSKEIIKWHKAEQVTAIVIDTVDFFQKLGFEIDVFDIVKARGPEQILDLNFNIPTNLIGKYDFVFESVCHQCFNIGTAFSNAFRLLKKDGLIFHFSPACAIDSGFYSISPCLFKDMYLVNCGEILYYLMYKGTSSIEGVFTSGVNELENIKNVCHKTWHMCVAQKLREINGFQIPTRSKFVKNPNSKL